MYHLSLSLIHILNIAELDEAVSLAKENNVILAEAMTIYHMPVYKTVSYTHLDVYKRQIL